MEEKRQRNLQIIEERRGKYSLEDIGQKYQISVPRVWTILKNTKRKLRQERNLRNQNRTIT